MVITATERNLTGTEERNRRASTEPPRIPDEGNSPEEPRRPPTPTRPPAHDLPGDPDDPDDPDDDDDAGAPATDLAHRQW